MVYREMGAAPLDVDIKLRMLTYLARLCLGDKSIKYHLFIIINRPTISQGGKCAIYRSIKTTFDL